MEVDMKVGDIFTRKKGHGWQRQVTYIMDIDDCIMCAYRENLYDGRGWSSESACSADAIRRGGNLDSNIVFNTEN